jgi:hypothetical protein
VSNVPSALPLIEVPIPRHLREVFEREAEQQRKSKEQAQIAHLYTKVELICEPAILLKPIGAEVELEDTEPNWMLPRYQTRLTSIDAKKSDQISAYAGNIGELCGIPPEYQQYWKYVNRDNHTCRTNMPVPADTTVEKLGETKRYNQQHYRLYVRDIRTHEFNGALPFTVQHPIARMLPLTPLQQQQQQQLQQQPQQQLQGEVDYYASAFLILKYFDVRRQCLSVVSSVIMRSEATVRDLKAQMRFVLRKHGILPPPHKFVLPPQSTHNNGDAHDNDNHHDSVSQQHNTIPMENGGAKHQHVDAAGQGQGQAVQQQQQQQQNDKSVQVPASSEGEIYSRALKYYSGLRDAGKLSADEMNNLTDDEWRYPLIAYDEENVLTSENRPRLLELRDHDILYREKLSKLPVQMQGANLQHGDIVSMYIPYASTVLQDFRRQHEGEYKKWTHHRYNALYLQRHGGRQSPTPITTAEATAGSNSIKHAAITSTTINNQVIQSKSYDASLEAEADGETEREAQQQQRTHQQHQQQQQSQHEFGTSTGGVGDSANVFQLIRDSSLMRPVRREFFNNLSDYCSYLRYRLVVEFRSMPWKPHPSNPSNRQKVHPDNTVMFLELDKRWTMEAVATMLAERIEEYHAMDISSSNSSNDNNNSIKKSNVVIDPLQLRFYNHQSYTGQSGPSDMVAPDKHPSLIKLHQVLASYDPPILYYELSEYSWNDFNDNYLFDIQYVDRRNHISYISVLAPKDGTVADLQLAVARKVLPKRRRVEQGQGQGDDADTSESSGESSSSEDVNMNISNSNNTNNAATSAVRNGEDGKITTTHPAPAVAVAVAVNNNTNTNTIANGNDSNMNASSANGISSKRKSSNENSNMQHNGTAALTGDNVIAAASNITAIGTDGSADSVKRRKIEQEHVNESHVRSVPQSTAPPAVSSNMDGSSPVDGEELENDDDLSDNDNGYDNSIRDYSARYLLTTLCLWEAPECSIKHVDEKLENLESLRVKLRSLIIRVDQLSDEMAVGNLPKKYHRVWCLFFKDMPKGAFNHRWKIVNHPFLSYARVGEEVEVFKNRVADQFQYSDQRRQELRVAMLTAKSDNYRRGVSTYDIRGLQWIDELSDEEQEYETDTSLDEEQEQEEEGEGEEVDEQEQGQEQAQDENPDQGADRAVTGNVDQGQAREEVKVTAQDENMIIPQVPQHEMQSSSQDEEMKHDSGTGKIPMQTPIQRQMHRRVVRKRVPRIIFDDIKYNQTKSFFGIMDPHMKDKASQARTTRNSRQQSIRITLQTDQD